MRRWGLDALRGAMMLLGLAYHASWAYVPDIGRWYVVQDVSSSTTFVTLTGVLHAFRMQTFFVLAGLFARLSFDRRGAEFFRERAKRLLLPFALMWPVMLLADHGLRLAAGQDASWVLRPQHLWFLLATFGFCGVLGVVERVVGTSAFSKPLSWLLARPVSSLLGSVLIMPSAWLPDARPDQSVLPDVGSIVQHAPFFVFGWLLWPLREETKALARWSPALLVLGLASAVWLFSSPLQWQLDGKLVAAVITWACVLGWLGLGFRSAEVQRAEPPSWFWLIDSAYWVYLVHYPLVVALHLSMRTLSWPSGVKFALVLGGTLLATLSSWRLVRKTPLGALLGAR